MLAGWRHAYANVALTGSNLAFLLIALRYPTPAGAGLAAGIVGITSFYAWHVNLKRYSAVADTPTSRIASAPQGYVEFFGKGVRPQDSGTFSPVSGLPCLWYRYRIEKKIGNKWQRVSSGESSEEFGLDDGTGMVLVDPTDAEIITSHKQVTIKGRFRHTEWSLIEGETLYVLGEHTTYRNFSSELEFHRDVSELLAEWKRDKLSLLKRFDKDSDGTISMEEWGEARSTARKQVELAYQEMRLDKAVQIIRKPAGRPYIIANRTPEDMASRYRTWAWVHLGLITMACLTLASLL